MSAFGCRGSTQGLTKVNGVDGANGVTRTNEEREYRHIDMNSVAPSLRANRCLRQLRSLHRCEICDSLPSIFVNGELSTLSEGAQS